jgi:hypothetical protein
MQNRHGLLGSLFFSCVASDDNGTPPVEPIRYTLTLNFNEEIILASNKGRAYFALMGYHFNPDDITRLLGIEPTSVNAAGAYSGLDKPVISSWELSTETVDSDMAEVDVFALTDIIVKQLEPVKEKIVEVSKSHNLSPRLGVVLTLSIDKGESSPEVGFGARTIRFLADTGSFIDMEYKLSERI